MNRTITLCAAIAVLCLSTTTFAHDDHHMPGMKVVTKTVTGEVVDMGCYLGHGARGEKHESCGNKCLAQGMPMGVLTSNGSLYLVTLDHDNADPYNSMKTMAGKT